MSRLNLPRGHLRRFDPEAAARIVAALAEVKRADVRARRMARRLRARPRARLDDTTWVAYEDLRLHQRTLRQEAYFDLGWTMGRVAGELAAAARADRGRAAEALLQVARALVLGL